MLLERGPNVPLPARAVTLTPSGANAREASRAFCLRPMVPAAYATYDFATACMYAAAPAHGKVRARRRGWWPPCPPRARERGTAVAVGGGGSSKRGNARALATERCCEAKATDRQPPTGLHRTRITHRASRTAHHAPRITQWTSRTAHRASRTAHHATGITHRAPRITYRASRVRASPTARACSIGINLVSSWSFFSGSALDSYLLMAMPCLGCSPKLRSSQSMIST